MIYHNVDEIFQGIEKIRASLLAKLENVTDAKLAARENGEGWSVAEIIEHIAMVQGGVVKITEKLLPGAESEGVKSDGNFDPPISFVEIATKAKDEKYVAPPHVHPQGGYDLAKLLTALEENYTKLNDLRPRIEATDLSNTAFPHPAFGNLTVYQWLIVAGLHEYRHLSQIERILTQIS